jgi:hypothetical protein
MYGQPLPPAARSSSHNAWGNGDRQNGCRATQLQSSKKRPKEACPHTVPIEGPLSENLDLTGEVGTCRSNVPQGQFYNPSGEGTQFGSVRSMIRLPNKTLGHLVGPHTCVQVGPRRIDIVSSTSPP